MDSSLSCELLVKFHLLVSRCVGVELPVPRVLSSSGNFKNQLSTVHRLLHCNLKLHLVLSFKSVLKGVDFYAINTDSQALLQSVAQNPIKIGELLTRGLGTGGNPLLGEQASEESKEAIRNALKGSDLVFIIAGMGGGTGSAGSCSNGKSPGKWVKTLLFGKKKARFKSHKPVDNEAKQVISPFYIYCQFDILHCCWHCPKHSSNISLLMKLKKTQVKELLLPVSLDQRTKAKIEENQQLDNPQDEACMTTELNAQSDSDRISKEQAAIHLQAAFRGYVDYDH